MPEDPAALELAAFVDASPSPFHAVATVADRLDDAGFTAVDERSAGGEVPGRGYVVRDGSIVAWAGGFAPNGWRIVGAHTDSPNLRVKPRPDTGRIGWRQLGVEPYGGILRNSWLGRDLGLSGRVALRDGSLALVKVDRPVLHLPQLAIHLDRSANDGLELNPQIHLTPVWGVGGPVEGDFVEWLAGELGAGVEASDVVAWDVMTHDLAPAGIVGPDGELFAAGRLDNLASCWAAVDALLLAGQGVVALWDHEEIGSETNRGAGSPLLGSVLERLAGGDRAGLAAALAGTVCVSADMAHATHPNYPERHEPEHHIRPGGGPAIKTNVNQRYATDARSAAVFVAACESAGVEHQWYAHRADLPCGSTIGPITAANLGISVVDIGAPMLAMHSARELMATSDIAPYRAAMAAFLAG